MALKKLHVLLLFILALAVNVQAQTQAYMDSLEFLMSSQRADTMDKDRQMKNHLKLASFYNHTKPDHSISFASKALKLAREIRSSKGEGMALNMIGISMANLSKADSARLYYESSLKIFEATNDTMGMMHLYNNLGNLTTNRGHYSEAVRYYQQVLRLSEATQKKELIALSSNNLAIVYFDWGKYDLALEFYRKSLSLLQKMGDTVRIAAIYNNIGELYKEIGQADSALHHYHQALNVAYKTNNSKSMMNAYLNLGDAMVLRNKTNDALEYYRLASEKAQEIKSDYGKAYAMIHQSELFLKTNRPDKAGPLAHEGLQLAEKQKHVKLQKEAQYQLFLLYQQTAQYESALKHHLAYTALKDTLFNQSSRKEIAQLQTEFETAKKESEIAQLNEEKAVQQLEIDRQRNLRLSTTLVALVLLLGVAFFYMRARMKQAAVKNNLEKQKLEVEHKLLRAQINPHFVFNALNSIQAFVLGNQLAMAQNYLSKLAQLIRLNLENSRKTMVSIENELKTLRLNLELEQMRFSHQFDFAIETDAAIDVENTYIPPMLIQPFVENALIHGIQPKGNGGQIHISLKQDAKAITAIVSDNGIGRKAASLKNSGLKSQHQSLGQQLTSERLELFGTKDGQSFYFTVTDLYDDQQQAAGTSVRIVMPFESDI